ncbi:MAG: PD40 domain-containing protein [Spirochaetes bacterium]|nr:PD40 domain-containing protein [Spirochaetota bacterium]
MGDKKMKHFLLLFAFLIPVSGLFAASKKEVAFKYNLMLKDSFDEKGSGRVIPLVFEKSVETDGSLSFDGNYLVYSSDKENGNYDIYLRSMTGIETVRLTTHASKDFSCSLSPDSRSIVFVSDREDPAGDIFFSSVSLDSISDSASTGILDKNIVNLTSIADQNNILKMIKDSDPVWSPDSKTVAFSSNRDGEENIYLINPSNRSVKKLTEKGGIYPSFSSDGKRIVFVSYRDNRMGDIYILDVQTGKESLAVSDDNIKLYPVFASNNKDIIYTSISSDTNGDKEINLKDKSEIVCRDYLSGKSFRLTYSKGSSFKARYFPSYSLKYFNSEEKIFNGVILYSEQLGTNINVNMLPEYGEIPRRKSAKDQYELALTYSDETDAEFLYDYYMRSYYFHNSSNADSNKPFIIRSMASAMRYASEEKLSLSGEVDVFMKMLARKDKYAELLQLLLSGKPESAAQRLSEAGDRSSMLVEDIADYYAQREPVKAMRYYKKLIDDDPKYYAISAVYYKYAMCLRKTDPIISEVPSELEYVFLEGSSSLQEKAADLLISFYAGGKSKTEDDRRINDLTHLIDSYKKSIDSKKYEGRRQNGAKILLSTLYYARGSILYAQGKEKISGDDLQKAMEGIRTTFSLFYKCNILLARINSSNPEDEAKYLHTALSNYLPRWKIQDVHDTAEKLLSYYEKKGFEFENQGKYASAAELYSKSISLVSYLYQRGKFNDLYDKYAPRAHVLYIDAKTADKNFSSDVLSSLEKEYLKNLNIARMDFDKAYIYALAYIYSKKAVNLSSEKAVLPADDFADNFKKSIEQTDWALFMDDSFSDAYLLKGWIFQYIDLLRLDESDGNFNAVKTADKNFDKYLFEKARALYIKAISANNEKNNPEKEGNLYLNLGNVNFLLMNYSEALSAYKSAQIYKKNYGSKIEEAVFLYHLSYCYWQSGNYSKAKEEMAKVHSVYRSLITSKNRKDYAFQLYHIYKYFALFERMDRNYAEAEKWYQRMIDHAKRYGIKSDEARFYQEIAFCRESLGDNDSALSFLKKSESLLADMDNSEKKYYLKLKAFYVLGPFPVWNLGADTAVIGSGRISGELNKKQKSLLNLSMIENINYKSGELEKAAAYIKKKIEIAGDEDSAFYKNVMFSSYNNLGEIYFKLKRYQDSEKYFSLAWAEGEKEENSEVVFSAVKNLTELYCFLAEKGMKKPDEIEVLSSKIAAYRALYETQRYNSEYEALEKNAERDNKTITKDEIAALKTKIAVEAKAVYAELDISSALLSIAKQEMLISRGNEYDGSVYQKASVLIEARLQDQTISKSMRARLLLNLSLCYDRLELPVKAYSILGNAQTFIESENIYKLVPSFYNSFASFLKRRHAYVHLSYSSALEVSRAGIERIERFPQLFSAYSGKVEDLYRNYACDLADAGLVNDSFYVLERLSSFKKNSRIFNYSPDFSDEKMNSKMNSIKKSYAEYNSVISKIGNDQLTNKELINKLELITERVRKETESDKEISSYFSVEKSVIKKNPKPYYIFLNDKGKMRSWRVLDGKVSTALAGESGYSANVSDAYVLINEESLSLNLPNAVYVSSFSDIFRLPDYYDIESYPPAGAKSLSVEDNNLLNVSRNLFAEKYFPVKVSVSSESLTADEILIFADSMIYSGVSEGIVSANKSKYVVGRNHEKSATDTILSNDNFEKIMDSGDLRSAKKYLSSYMKSRKADDISVKYFNSRILESEGFYQKAFLEFPYTAKISESANNARMISFGLYLLLKNGEMKKASDYMKLNSTILSQKGDYAFFNSILNDSLAVFAGKEYFLNEGMLISLANSFSIMRNRRAVVLKSMTALGNKDRIINSGSTEETDASGEKYGEAVSYYVKLKKEIAAGSRSDLQSLLGKIKSSKFSSDESIDVNVCCFAAAYAAESIGEYLIAAELYDKVRSPFDADKERALVRRASLLTFLGRYNDSEKIVKSFGAVSSVHRIISAENALFSGSKNADTLIEEAMITADSASARYHVQLLKAHSLRMKILKGDKTVSLKDYEKEFISALSIAQKDLSVLRSIRQDLFIKGIDFIIMLNFKEKKYADALRYAEIKQQVSFSAIVSPESRNVSSAESEKFKSLSRTDFSGCFEMLSRNYSLYYNCVLPSLPLQMFQNKISENSAVLYFSESEGDLLVWIIGKRDISGIRIENGYSKAKQIEASGKLSGDEKIHKLSDLYSRILKNDTFSKIFIIADNKSQEIPFSVIFSGRFEAYLTSVSSALVYSGKDSPVRTIHLISNDEADSAAINQSSIKIDQKSATKFLRGNISVIAGDIISNGKSLSALLSGADNFVYIDSAGEISSNVLAEYSYSCGNDNVIIISSDGDNISEYVSVSSLLQKSFFEGISEGYKHLLDELSGSARFSDADKRSGYRYFKKGFSGSK